MNLDEMKKRLAAEKASEIEELAEFAKAKGLKVTPCDCSASLRIENQKGDWIKIEHERRGPGGDQRWNVVEWCHFAGVLKSRNALNSMLHRLSTCS